MDFGEHRMEAHSSVIPFDIIRELGEMIGPLRLLPLDEIEGFHEVFSPSPTM